MGVTSANRHPGRIAPGSRVDVAIAAALALLVLPLYLATMYPDVVASGDSAKFAYLGAVLGTAHPPGYPFYTLLSFAFSFVPLGNLAWRMNFLSVCAGLLTVAATYLAARRIGSPRITAALLALGLATGIAFWNKSLAAEVYTVGALLLVTAVWRVLVWRESQRDRDLLTAVALLSLGLGNHLTIAAVAPAFIAFVVLVDARRALRPRVIGFGALFVCLGLAQYGYIVLRTWQGSPHLEASASSLGELYRVVTAAKYSDAMFEMSWAELRSTRLPVLARLVLDELTPAGVLAASVGLTAGLLRAWRECLLVAGSAAGILALTMNVSADTQGFITPALPCLWLLGAFAPSVLPRRGAGRLLTVAVTGLVALTVTRAVPKNFRYADHSDRTIERRLWTAVFEAVPDRTVIVAESYVHDQGLKYMLFGEGIARSRGIQLVQRDPHAIDQFAREDGRTVVAFEQGVAALERNGFEFERLTLLDWPLGRITASSRQNRFVVLALQPAAVRLLVHQEPSLVRQLGGSWTPSSQPVRYGVVGVPSNGRFAAEHVDADAVDLRVPGGQQVGPGASLPVPVAVRVTEGRILIQVGNEPPVDTPGPFAAVVLNQDGRIRQRHLAAASWTLRPPIEAPAAFRLTASSRCIDIGDLQWHDLSALGSTELLLRVNNYRPYEAEAVVYAGSDAPFRPELKSATGPRDPVVSVLSLAPGARERALATDGVQRPDLMRVPHLVRIAVRVNDDGDEATLKIALSTTPSVFWGRGKADRVAAPRVQACARATFR